MLQLRGYRILPASLVALAACSAIAASPASSAIRDLLQPYVDNQVIAGAVALVATQDQVLCREAVGWADIAARKPMSTDCLFGIASMSKPIAAVAVMRLVDEGKLRVEDPVEKYLPEFHGQMVLAEHDANHVLLQKAQQPLLIRHVLSHTGGLMYKTLPETPADVLTLAAAVRTHAASPLQFEPGTKNLYSSGGIAVAARIVEVVSHMPFERFLAERLFQPLGMTDTTFVPTAAQLPRVARLYRASADNSGLNEVHAERFTYPLDDPRRQPIPGSGLFSTAGDMCQFCHMILGRGMTDGKRYLSEAAFAEMTRRQTPDTVKANYGLGWERYKDHRIGHGGSFQTYMTVDFDRGLITILLMQHDGPWQRPEGKEIWPRVMAAAKNLGLAP